MLSHLNMTDIHLISTFQSLVLCGFFKDMLKFLKGKKKDTLGEDDRGDERKPVFHSCASYSELQLFFSFYFESKFP